jgi:hypothetical protein
MEGLNAKAVAYADDILITAEGANGVAVRLDADEAVAMAIEWGTNSGISFNPSKTEMLLVTNKKKDLADKIHVGNSTIESSPEITYLGVKIDERLTFRKHLTEKTKKMTKLLGLPSNDREGVGTHHRKGVVGLRHSHKIIYSTWSRGVRSLSASEVGGHSACKTTKKGPPSPNRGDEGNPDGRYGNITGDNATPPVAPTKGSPNKSPN